MSKNPQTKDKTTEKINALLDEAVSTPEPIRYVRMVDGQLLINGVDYEVVKDHKDAFDVDKLNDCYSDILNKYDYIVGDWGYDQLRLRGFYRDNNHQANRDQLIGTFEDYLYEYCNFGCAYFILKRTGAPYRPKNNNHKNQKRKNHSRRRSTNNKKTNGNGSSRNNNNSKAKTNNNTKQSHHNSNNHHQRKTNHKSAKAQEKTTQPKTQKFKMRRLDEKK